jgi:hypothetical protein
MDFSHPNAKWVNDLVDELEDQETLTADGLDGAIVGLWIDSPSGPRVIYSQDKCIDIFVERDGMSYEEASEYFDFNVSGAYMGPRTPIFISTPEED